MRYVIIVAGGSGARLKSEQNGDTPKQFLLLAGKPVLMHTLEKFNQSDRQIKIILVLPEKNIEQWNILCRKYNLQIQHQISLGGETRFHSVKNGLELIKESGVTGVHDGVRPLASVALIKTCYEQAEKFGNAVPCIPVPESIRHIIDKDANEVADRNSFVTIQTPQCFDSEILKKAYSADLDDVFTDDASVVEYSGQPIHLIEGERENIKITYLADFAIAEVFLSLAKSR